MKLISILFLALIFSSRITCAQTSTLNGRSFTVLLYIQKKRDSVDTLKFQNNSMTFGNAKKYGFIVESMKAKEKNGNIHFVSTFNSKKNGDMVWDGTVINDSIAGTCIWDRPLENPINYTFTGKEDKNR